MDSIKNRSLIRMCQGDNWIELAQDTTLKSSCQGDMAISGL
jgi:hypothetical protein